MRFRYVYKSLAHPGHNGYVDPFTLEERLMHVREAERTLGSEVSWVVDTMDNDLKHLMGNAPNSEFLLDPDGRVVRKRAWSDPEELRADLAELLGTSPTTTHLSDLNLPTAPPPKEAASEVVSRLERPDFMQPLWIDPETGPRTAPFYAKLRAEANDDLLDTGIGKLYLGFHIDPIYHVHWNNLTKPIRISLSTPDDAEVRPQRAQGPKVEQAADVDPREFLIDVCDWNSDEPIALTVSYFACNDEEEWCKFITQRVLIRRRRDPDAGRPMRRWRRAIARGPRDDPDNEPPSPE